MSRGKRMAGLFLGIGLLLGAGVLVALALWRSGEPAPGSLPGPRPAPQASPQTPLPQAVSPTATAAPARSAPPHAEPPRAEPSSELLDAAFADAQGRPTRAFVRAALESAVEQHHPGLKLSPDQLERAADAAVQLRDAREALRELPETLDAAEVRRALVEQIATSTAQFEEAMDMSPAEFTEQTEPSGGLDRFDPDEVVPEPEFLEDTP